MNRKEYWDNIFREIENYVAEGANKNKTAKNAQAFKRGIAERLARSYGKTVADFSDEFSGVTGKTLYMYITERVENAAIKLIINNGWKKSREDVLNLTGYQDQQAFYKWLRNRHNCKPSEVNETMLQDVLTWEALSQDDVQMSRDTYKQIYKEDTVFGLSTNQFLLLQQLLDLQHFYGLTIEQANAAYKAALASKREPWTCFDELAVSLNLIDHPNPEEENSIDNIPNPYDDIPDPYDFEPDYIDPEGGSYGTTEEERQFRRELLDDLVEEYLENALEEQYVDSYEEKESDYSEDSFNVTEEDYSKFYQLWPYGYGDDETGRNFFGLKKGQKLFSEQWYDIFEKNTHAYLGRLYETTKPDYSIDWQFHRNDDAMQNCNTDKDDNYIMENYIDYGDDYDVYEQLSCLGINGDVFQNHLNEKVINAEIRYEQGFDKHGFDKEGIHKDTHTEYDSEGFDKTGFNEYGFIREGYHKIDLKQWFKANFYFEADKDGYDKQGYDKNGFDRAGFNKQHLNKTTGTTYDTEGYDYQGYDSDGYDRKGFDKSGYDREGFDKNGLDNRYFNRQHIHDKTGTIFDRTGYDFFGFDKEGYDRHGFDHEGYNKKGFDQNGYDRRGFNVNHEYKDTREHYDLEGFDYQGYNTDGYDRDGYDRDGFDQDGYDHEGFNRELVDREGNTRYWLELNSYDDEGFNRDGFNREGYDRNGLDKNGRDVFGRLKGSDKKEDA